MRSYFRKETEAENTRELWWSRHPSRRSAAAAARVPQRTILGVFAFVKWAFAIMKGRLRPRVILAKS